MTNWLHKLSHWELVICLFFNKLNHQKIISLFFMVISKLGDGILWYSIIFLLPWLYGKTGMVASIHMLSVGIACLTIYILVKKTTSRLRPFELTTDILQSVPPLDRYSFPSGHTLHAIAFSIVLLHYFPIWGWLVIPFTILVAISRLVLGLHYPTDVLAGALLGTFISIISFWLKNLFY